MKRKLKVLICIILSFFLTFSTVVFDYFRSVKIVYADDYSLVEITKECFLSLLRVTGVILKDTPENFNSFIDFTGSIIADTIDGVYDSFTHTLSVDAKYISLSDKQTVIATEPLIEAINLASEKYIANRPDYIIAPTRKYSDVPPSQFVSDSM